jgi:hypothetical protein
MSPATPKSTKTPPGWAVDLVRAFSPEMSLVWRPWTPDELVETFGGGPHLVNGAGTYRWCVVEAPCERNRRDPDCRILEVCDVARGSWAPIPLERDWMLAELRALDIRLAGGEEAWVKRLHDRAARAATDEERAFADALMPEIAPVCGDLLIQARERSFGDLFQIDAAELAALDFSRQVAGGAPLTDRQKFLLLHAQNPVKVFGPPRA